MPSPYGERIPSIVGWQLPSSLRDRGWLSRGLSTLRWLVAFTPRPKKSGRFQLTVFLCNVSRSSMPGVLSTPPLTLHGPLVSMVFRVCFDAEKVSLRGARQSKRLNRSSSMYRSLPDCNLIGRDSGVHNALSKGLGCAGVHQLFVSLVFCQATII